MKWIISCINNKLIIYILAILLCVLGIFCISIMKIAPFPVIPSDNISISLNYPGANAQTVDRQVTSKLVSGLQSINNIQTIIANSKAGSANIDLTLNAEDTDKILQTQMQISQAIASSDLPTVVPQPQLKIGARHSTLMYLALTSSETPLFKLQTIVKSTLLPNLASLPDVFVRTATEDFHPVVKIMLSPEAIAAYKLDPVAVAQSLNAVYQSSPLGELNIQNQTYVLNMFDSFKTLDELRNIMVGYQHADGNGKSISLFGEPVYLKDIATINFEQRKPVQDSIFKINNKTAVGVLVGTTSNANPFTVAQKTNDYLNLLQKDLPSDIKILRVFNDAVLMQDSIHEVIMTIAFSSILVLLIAFIFLGVLRATLIPIVTIPVCLLGSITFLYSLGFTINLFTLLAIVIAVGLVVDDAVVVVENITRYLEQGMKRYQAVIQGTSDIALTIVGITLTLVFVYLPVMFSSNHTADLFKTFALTLASSIFVSGIVALTLTPVMAMTFLSDKPLNHYQLRFDHLLKNIIVKYHAMLAFVIRYQFVALSIIGAFIIMGGYAAMQLPKKVYPNEPDTLIYIHMAGSYKDTLESFEKKFLAFAPFYKNKMVSSYMQVVYKDTTSGQTSGMLMPSLKHEYIKSTFSFADKINQFIKKENIKNTFAQAENFLPTSGSYDMSFYIYGGSNIDTVNQAAEKISDSMQKTGNFSYVDNQVNHPQKQLVFHINNAKAASLGIFRQSITQLLSTYYSGYTLDNYFSIDGLSVPIVVQANNNNLMNPDSLQKFIIYSPIAQKHYPLADFVSLNIEAMPLVVTTFNGQPAVEIDANLNSHYSLGQAINYVNHFMETHYPSLQYQYVDNARSYLRGNNETLFIALMGILSVYFLLSILFKNLMDPLIIMLTVPFTVIGGALSLYLINGSINLFSALGLITLVGLITKHGILIVHFANDELKRGKSVIEAILASTSLRFRPIIMTTLIMVFGAVPLIFSSKIFYVSRENLGITIIGGLLIGTLFSLFIIPLIYVLVKKSEGEISGIVDN